MPIRILRIHDVMARTKISRSSIYAFEAKGDFPRRVRLSARSVGWIEAEIDAWLEARATVS